MKKKQMSFTCCCNFSLSGCKGVEQEHPSKHPAPLIKMNPDADTIIYQDQGKSQNAFLNLYILQATPAVLSKV